MNFPTEIELIEQRIRAIDPVKYAATRNYADGALTYLSPYISRGVFSTKQVYKQLKSTDLSWNQIEKLTQELAWRDYWQQIWIAKGDAIFTDLKHQQTAVAHRQMPLAIIEANTGIEVIDKAIKELYATGYMHNHLRMYVASICCNIARSHWLTPANWLYANLLDGDLASNALSWQWVSGSFSAKKYYANQDNINKFFGSQQKNTFLDVDYDSFTELAIPEVLKETSAFKLKTKLPEQKIPVLKKNKTTLIYNYYNLDPYWKKEEDVQRVLLFEPSFFERHPISEKSIDFMLALAKNIGDIQLFVGEFSELLQHIAPEFIVYREHPTNKNYVGKGESREWLSTVTGYFPSFFAFWKQAKKSLNA